MKTGIQTKAVLAWSPSGLKDYDKCPKQFKAQRLQSLCTRCFKGSYDGPKGKKRCTVCKAPPREEGPALARGTAIHDEADNYIRGLRKDISENLRKPKIKKTLLALRAAYVARKARTELDLAFTKEWKLTEWMASDVYLRVKVDFLLLTRAEIAEVGDWKTGSPHPDEYDDALNLYSVAALSAGFGKEATSKLLYTDHNEIIERPAGAVKLVQLGKLQKSWDGRAKKMFVDKKFPPRPGPYCRYCPYTQNKGGPCEF